MSFTRIAAYSPRAFTLKGRLVLAPATRSLVRTVSTHSDRECFVERLEAQDKGIAVLNLNRPASKNALGRVFMQQFASALEGLRFDESVRVVIVRSLVDRVFCAGADLKERTTMSPPEVAAFVHSLRSNFGNLESLPVPTIAAIDGAALGGGLEMALATDLRLAGAKLGLPETALAIIPGAGGTQRLPRLIGIPRAKQLIFTAQKLNAKEAAEIGLVNEATDGSAYEKALELARKIVDKGPVAIRMAKLAIDKGSQLDLSSGLAFEQTCYAQVIPTKDRLEGLAAFKEKRAPVYTGN
ncbi:ClpP/crotonase-like domain-containing protein [Phlyctochytrium arcticum]|nr:ClpP/crotonase-like domain-containing protein [Phlyctochytrium arcticum]